MSEPDIVKIEREIIRSFREAIRQRSEDEKSAADDHSTAKAMAEQAINDAERVLAEAEVEAKEQREFSIGQAQTRCATVQTQARDRRKDVEQSNIRVRNSLSMVSLEHLLDREFTPSNSSENESNEFGAGVDKTLRGSSKRLVEKGAQIGQASREVRKSNETRRLYRRIAIVVLFVFVLAGIAGIRGAYQNWNTSRYYTAGLETLDEGDWQAARAYFQYVLDRQDGYKDAENLIAESYYRSGIQAMENELWDQAQDDFQSLSSLAPDYKESQQLLKESYYQLAILALRDKDYQFAFDNLSILLANDINYKNSIDLLGTLITESDILRPATVNQEVRAKIVARNTIMTLETIEFTDRDRVRLNLSIERYGGEGTTKIAPGSVHLVIADDIIPATKFGGDFDNSTQALEIKLTGTNKRQTGWVDFDNSIAKLVAARCLYFHFGIYYDFEEVCVFE